MIVSTIERGLYLQTVKQLTIPRSIYRKVLKDLKNRLAVREESFPLTVAQI